MKKGQLQGIGIITFSLLVYPILITLINKATNLSDINMMIGFGQFIFGMLIVGWGVYLVVKPLVPEENKQ